MRYLVQIVTKLRSENAETVLDILRALSVQTVSRRMDPGTKFELRPRIFLGRELDLLIAEIDPANSKIGKKAAQILPKILELCDLFVSAHP